MASSPLIDALRNDLAVLQETGVIDIQCCDDDIERFYNARRRHPVLDYLSPVQFEKMMVAV